MESIDEILKDAVSFMTCVKMFNKYGIQRPQRDDGEDCPIIVQPILPGPWEANGKESCWVEDGRGNGSFIMSSGYLKGNESIIGDYLDLDANVTSYNLSYDSWATLK